jgi:hypothetical protein
MTAFFCRRVIKFDQLIARIGAEVCQDDLLARNWTEMSQLLSKVALDEVLQTLLLSKTNGFRLTKG